MLLITGAGAAEWNGTHVIVSIPSGRETVELAMTLTQGELLLRAIGDGCRAGFRARVSESIAASAEIVPFKRKKRRKA